MSHGGASRSAHHHSESDVTDLTHAGRDSTAIHDNVAGEINAITAKTTPAASDIFLIEDSAASNAKKKVVYSNLPSGSASDAIHGESAHDNGHDTNNNNWASGSDTEAWNHAITVTAGDLIIVEWLFAFDDLLSTTDPQGFIELDNGTQQLPATSSDGPVMLDSADGYIHAIHTIYVESTSVAAAYGWMMSHGAPGDAAPSYGVGQATSNTDQYCWAYLDTTNDFTGSCTLRGWLTAEPDLGTYYEEFVTIRHQAQVT